MPKINNMAELKRLPVGTKIKLIACRRAPNSYCKEWETRHNYPEHGKEPALNEQDLEQFIDCPHVCLNVPRTIEKMQTNAVKFSPIDGKERGSFLYFPSAKFFKPTTNGFCIMPSGIYDVMLSYEVEA